ncbi:hypothetical protein ScPMuIL_017392 [Solemya velum]
MAAYLESTKFTDEEGLEFTLSIPPKVLDRCSKDPNISSFIFNKLQRKYGSKNKSLDPLESQAILEEVGLFSPEEAAEGNGVQLGKQARFDEISSAAYSRADISDMQLQEFARTAPRHLSPQEKVRYLEVKVASCPKQDENSGSLEAFPNLDATDKTDGWTIIMCKLLIDTRVKLMSKFQSSIFKKNQCWQMVADVLKSHGYIKTGTECDIKWRGLKGRYKKIVDGEKKTGRGRQRKWDLFDSMHEVLCDDPSVHPICVLSTTLTSAPISNTKNNATSSTTSTDSVGLCQPVQNTLQPFICPPTPSTAQTENPPSPPSVVMPLPSSSSRKRRRQETLISDQLKTLIEIREKQCEEMKEIKETNQSNHRERMEAHREKIEAHREKMEAYRQNMEVSRRKNDLLEKILNKLTH